MLGITWATGGTVAEGAIVAVAVGAGVDVGMGVSVSVGITGTGEAVHVGAGATVAAVLQAVKMKAAARRIPVNRINTFLGTMIQTLSLGKEKPFISLSYHTANSRSTGLALLLRICQQSCVITGRIIIGRL